jgi:hypothetical protein
MKKILLLAFVLCNLATSAQVQQKVSSSDIYRTNQMNAKEAPTLTGTPYLDPQYTLAEVDGVSDLVLVKYNAQHDHFDIDSGDGKIYTLPKNADMGSVKYKNGRYHFIFGNYTTSKGVTESGYLMQLLNTNGVSLLKKQRIILIPAKTGASSYQQDTPAKLAKANEEFYLKTKDGQIVSYPSNKKKLIDLFPQHKGSIESFIKDNKISFSDEKDLLSLTLHLSTL